MSPPGNIGPGFGAGAKKRDRRYVPGISDNQCRHPAPVSPILLLPVWWLMSECPAPFATFGVCVTCVRPGGSLPWALGVGRMVAVAAGDGGKSGLHRAGCQVTPGRREPTESATENTPPKPKRAGKGEMVR